MAIKNPSDLVTQIARLPAAVEKKLPAGAPKISATITDAAGKLPKLPDFPVELPDLPMLPELPDLPMLAGTGNSQVVSARKNTNAEGVTIQETIASPSVGVIPAVITRRGM